MLRVAGLLTVLLLVINACNNVSCACVPTLFVDGASSLSGALDDMKSSHPGFHSNVQLIIETGSSTALRTQIEHGNRVDVFLSADTGNPQTLIDAGLATGPAVNFATNSLTIIVPRNNPAGIQTAADLARDDVRVITAGQGVPITTYAEQAVSQLAGIPGYPVDFFDLYQGNVASREDNVGAVVSKIQLGEGDAAIVYVTDAQAADVATVDIPEVANVVATYAGVVVQQENTPKWAHEFLAWLRGSDGQRILASHGFSSAP